MFKCKAVWASLLFVLWAGAAFGADQYTIDPVHSQIGFGVKHLVISTVKGRFNEFSGTILYDASDVTKSSVEVTIKTASIDTGVSRRDDDLRSANFFDAANHPELAFKSSRIEKTSDGLVAHGTLTMHGVSKEIDLPFTLTGPIQGPGNRPRLGVEASLTIDRRDWGLTYSRAMEGGGLVVSNDVKIELNIEAAKPREPAPPAAKAQN